ncbi:MAG: ATP-grasp domain-containing protein [Desulfosalsimonas sp.]
MDSLPKAVCLENHLRGCPGAVCLGVRPNFADYSPPEAEMIRNAEKIYYPSIFYADMFAAMGKPIFPSIHTYRFAQDKIKQTALFEILDVPRPGTRVFYGGKKRDKITRYFDFPFVAKIPRGSAMGRGVYLVRTQQDLDAYCLLTKTAYIQEYLPIKEDIRVVVIGDEPVHAYRRIAAAGEFRSNLGCGAQIRTDGVPKEATRLALDTARRCGWNDVGIDICFYRGRPFVLEANMKYGRTGFAQAGMDYFSMMEERIRDGRI